MRSTASLVLLLLVACQCRSALKHQAKSSSTDSTSVGSHLLPQIEPASPVCDRSDQIAYSQPLANAQRNSLGTTRFCRQLGRRIEVAMSVQSDVQGRKLATVLTYALLGDSNPNRVVSFADSLVGVVDLGVGKVTATVANLMGGWEKLLPNERLVGAAAAIDLASMTAMGQQYSIPVTYQWDIGMLLGMHWQGDTLTAVGWQERSGHGPAPKNYVHMVRASLQRWPLSASHAWAFPEPPKELWRIDDLGRAFPSPFLSDGSVAVVREQEIIWVSGNGKPLKSFPVKAVPNRVSVGLDDGILAFEATDGGTRLHILGKDHTTQIAFGQRKPLQPALSLPGGRVVVVTEDSVVNIFNGEITWEWKYDSHLPLDPHPNYYLPKDWDAPVATGTLDGCVVVRWEQQVVTLDPNGKPIWRMRTPDRILSNPLVTANGGVCVAIPNRVICEMP